MSLNSILKLPNSQQDWALLYCRVMSLFALQGLVLLVLYAVLGFGTSPDDMPLGFQLDPLHAVIHLVTGLIAVWFGFWRPAGAVRFLQVFTIFYLALAVFGTFTDIHFGMQLELEENALHWPLSLIAGLISFGPLLASRFARSAG